MSEVYIVSAVRTAVGRMGGIFKDIQPDELASVVISEALNRTNINGTDIDEIIIGQTKQSADFPNIARVAALRAGISEHVPAYTVMRQCGSGLQAVINAYQIILSNMGDIVVAGGVESMSNAPYYLRQARYGYKAGNAVLADSNTESQPKSQPEDIYGSFTMGMTAENLANMYDISREEQDKFALNSQIKANNAITNGYFKEEIVPVKLEDRKGNVLLADIDENPRYTTIDELRKLKAVFKEDGSVTAGNSSSRNDGASAVVAVSKEKVKELNLNPLVKIISCAATGTDPRIMGIGPVDAIKKALKNAELKIEDIDVIELNEAFAAQSLAVLKELNIDEIKVNPNGGAIALGHPLGCSGTRILTTLIYEMKRRNYKYGLAAICIAGGQGLAMIIENVEYA